MAPKPPITELIDEAQAIIARLVPVKGNLPENACEFVMSLDEKFKRYGYGAYLSDAQMKWLRILDKEYSPDERQTGLFED